MGHFGSIRIQAVTVASNSCERTEILAVPGLETVKFAIADIFDADIQYAPGIKNISVDVHTVNACAQIRGKVLSTKQIIVFKTGQLRELRK